MTPQPALAVAMDAAPAPEAQPHGESRLDRALPWASSFLMHAGLAIIAIFACYLAVSPPQSEGRVIFEPSGVVADIHELSSPFPPGGDDSRPALQNVLKNVPPSGLDVNGTLDGPEGKLGGASLAAMLNVIGDSSRGGYGPGAVGLGDGMPGRIAAFGPPGGGSTKGILFRPGAMRTVYLLDHSGSMLETFDFLRAEVKNCISDMLPVQKFSIIMFSEDVEVLGPERLLPATNENKHELLPKVDAVRAQGENDYQLLPFQHAFEKAFAMKPDHIVFLTDGEFDPALVQVVKNLNKEGKVKVSTIAYVRINPDSAAQLKEIARQNGGQYKFVAESDLGR